MKQLGLIILGVFLPISIYAQDWKPEILAEMQRERDDIFTKQLEITGLTKELHEREKYKAELQVEYNNTSLEVRQIDLKIKGKELERDKVKLKIETMVNNPDISTPSNLQFFQGKNLDLQNEITQLGGLLQERTLEANNRKGKLAGCGN